MLPEWALTVFRHHLHSGRFMRESRITTNIAHLSAGRFAEVEFRLPPIAEQERIVAAIAAQFSRLDAGVSLLMSAQRKLKRLRASVLEAAVSGTLIGQTSDAWPVAELGELLDGLHAGKSFKCDERPSSP